MSFSQSNGLRYYTFDSLADSGIVHGVFTRRGGVSPNPWQALNLGGTVGDDPGRVRENRLRIFHAVKRLPDTLYDVWQVHGKDVICADAPRDPNREHLKADAILTDRPEVTLLMRFADCVPILLYDPVRGVVGLVHTGWKGTVERTAAAAIESMQRQYGSQPADIRAAIGPSIAAHHYEIGPEVIAQVQESFGQDAAALLPARGSAVQFDLWAANQLILEQAGVRQVELAGLCTACHPEDWYSHRGEHGRTGRFGALIGLSDT